MTDTRLEIRAEAKNSAPCAESTGKNCTPELTRTDLERDLFVRGKQVLGRSSGGLIARLLKAKDGNVALARSAIEYASTKEDPREYVARICGPIQRFEPGRGVEGYDNGLVYVPFAHRDAWDAYGRTIGKTYPRDRSGGWWFPTLEPPK